MEVAYSRDFKKDFAKLQKKTQLHFFDRLSLYLEDPQHPLLRVHTLSGNYLGYQSFNVTADVRVIFTIRDNRTVLYLDMIGTHSQLYR
jgi:addiction module RelE/StbE family toxin